jgi:hypothetical protein
MKFIFPQNNYFNIPECEINEFDTLEEFAEWTNTIECPRFVLVPPYRKNTWSNVANDTEYWLIWTYPDQD